MIIRMPRVVRIVRMLAGDLDRLLVRVVQAIARLVQVAQHRCAQQHGQSSRESQKLVEGPSHREGN